MINLLKLISPITQRFLCHRYVCTSVSLKKPILVKMPSLSPTMSEGSIVNWVKKEGDQISAGDVLCEVQTDKAVVALECDEDGTLAKIIVDSDVPNIKVGDLIGVLATSDEDWKDVSTNFVKPENITKPDSETIKDTPQPSQSNEAKVVQNSKIGPAVRLLLQTHNLNVSQIPATGPRDQLLKGDVLAYLSAKPSEPTISSQTGAQIKQAPKFVDIPLSNIRKVISKRLTQSKTEIPHTYVSSAVSIDDLLLLRKKLKDENGIKLSVNDFVIKACALALRLVPEINANVDPTTQIAHTMPDIDICIAVATPTGLITPILPSTDKLNLSDIANLSGEMALKARENKLKPHEFQGGSFTISNLGMFGIKQFTAIINMPQVAILAVGAGISTPKLSERSGKIYFSSNMTMTLSIDSRFVNEVKAGLFLSYVSDFLTYPSKMLAHGNSSIELDSFCTAMLNNST